MTNPSQLEADAAAPRQACEHALRYLRVGDTVHAIAWLEDVVTNGDAGHELCRWCEARRVHERKPAPAVRRGAGVGVPITCAHKASGPRVQAVGLRCRLLPPGGAAIA